MRKALVILALSVSALLVSDSFVKIYAGTTFKEPAQKYKYEYLFETDLTTEKFKDAFYSRLMSKHNWSPMAETNLMNDTYNSIWSFTDDNEQKWECSVTIKRESNQKVAVTLEMEPILGS